MKKIYGSCLCGGVSFELNGKLRPVIYCHCGQCRKTHGHFAAYTAVTRDRIEWKTQKSLNWFDSSASARRGFCCICGSSLFYELKNGNKLSVSAGVLDKPTRLYASGHIFFSDRSDYYEALDKLPRFDQESRHGFSSWES